MNHPIQRSDAHLMLLVVAFCSGISCLIYELVWSRYLQLIFGLSVYAVATVLCCFMLGLALGSWDVGRRIDSARNVRMTLVRMQLGIAGYLLISPVIYSLLSPVAHWLPEQALLRHAVRFVFSFIALIIPTYLMGGSLPVLLKLSVRTTDRVGSDFGRIYALNTLGGAAGAFFTGFFFIPKIGLTFSLMLAAVLSIVTALLVRYAVTDVAPSPSEPTHEEPSRETKFKWMVLAFAISGFTSLAYEVYWTRILSLFFRDSIYDLTIVLTTFLCGIVLGSLIGSRLSRKLADPVFALAMVEALIGFCAVAGLIAVGRFPGLINYLQTNTSLVDRFGEQYWLMGILIRFSYASLLMLVPTALFGATFPLVARICIDTLPKVGHRGGFINSMNTVGSALGALVAGFVLISLLGTQNSILFTACLNIATAAILIGRVSDSRRWTGLLAVVALIIFAGLFVPAWDKLRMSTSFLDPNQPMPLNQLLRLEYYKDDAHGITSVVELKPAGPKYLVTNRLYGQNTSDMLGLTDHRRLGLIPALLHPNPRSALVIGLGAGMTLRGVADSNVQRTDCVEISPGVMQAARYFADQNNRVMENPKVRFIVDDGRNFIGATHNRYDLVVLDILHPMSSGSSTVFSREYYELCKQRMQAGGIVCQWLPVHQLSMSEIKTIVATFHSAFQDTSLWFGLIGDSVAAIGCIGTNGPIQVDFESLAEQLRDPVLLKSAREVGLDHPELLLSNFIMQGDAISEFALGSAIDRDDKPIIEFAAPRLATQSSRQGMLNLLAFAPQMRAIQSLANAPTEFTATLEKALAGKRAIVEGLRFALNDNMQGQMNFYDQALAKDPTNADLLFVIRELTQGP